MLAKMQVGPSGGSQGFTGLGGEFIAKLSNTNVSVLATAGGCLGVIYGGQLRCSYDPCSRPSIRINIRFPGKLVFFRRSTRQHFQTTLRGEKFSNFNGFQSWSASIGNGIAHIRAFYAEKSRDILYIYVNLKDFHNAFKFYVFVIIYLCRYNHLRKKNYCDIAVAASNY